MALGAPLRVPVELERVRAAGRWFRLAHEISVDEIDLDSAVSEELEGPLAVAFHLPGEPRPVRAHGQAVEVVVGEGAEERAERRRIRFVDLDEDGRLRIESYIKERLAIFP